MSHDHRAEADTRRPEARPIVILGISQRSGTNHLARLVTAHPDCSSVAAPVKEDFLLAHAPMLLEYAERTAHRWPRRWGARSEGEAALVDGLARGLVAFLDQQADGGRPVTKTPSVDHLHLAPILLRHADVVVLVRDGRSVAESIHHGYRRSYSGAIRTWRHGARQILQLQRTTPASLRWTMVRHEDLVRDAPATLRTLFDFLDLDTDRYDLEKASSLPVTGSSFIHNDDGGIRWEPVERTAEFDPTTRHAGWSTMTRERFRWIAGTEQASLGYELDPSARPRILWVALNVLLDMARPVIAIRDAAFRTRRQIRLWWRARSGA